LLNRGRRAILRGVIHPASKSALLALSALVLGFAPASFAAPANSAWSFRVWQSDDGLPNDNVTSLAQTPDGYLWVATPTRLARFDGARFESISRDTFAPGTTQRTSTLLRSRDGGLWLGMDHGPIIYAKSGIISRFATNLPDEIVQGMVEDGDRALWIVYRGGPVCRLADGNLTRFTSANGLPGWTMCSMATGRDGRVWFAQGGEAGQFRDERFTTLFRVANQNTTIRVAASAAGGVWMCSDSDLLRVDESGKAQGMWSFPRGVSAVDTTALLEDRSGGVWVGTSDSGLFHFDGSRMEAVPTSHRNITSLLEDREGNIWAGTDGGGLNRIQPRAIVLDNAANGMPYESLTSVCEDTNGALWAVTQNGLLLCRSNGVWDTVSTNRDWPGGPATCVTADNAGAVWVGTATTVLVRIQDGKFTVWRATDGLASHRSHALLVDSRGGLWVAGVSPDSLQRLRDGRIESFKLPHGVGIIRGIAEDSRGNIWAGSTKGMLLRVGIDQRAGTAAEVTTTSSIRTLFSGSDGNLWIGFAGWGVGRLKDGTIASVKSDRGLYDDYISQVLGDGNGWLWFGSDHGIFRVREEELDKALRTPDGRVQSIHYGRDDGLASFQANFDQAPNCWRGRDGRLWLPMSAGLATVDPRQLHESSEAPPVLLTRVLVDDAAIASYGGVMPAHGGADSRDLQSVPRLPPDHRRLEFDFTALSFASPENVSFQYRLEGLDDHWVEAGRQRNAVYSRLPAGRYRFQVRARSGDGVWNTENAVLVFAVAPFFWQTWWFGLGALGTFTVGVIVAVRYVSFRRLQSKIRLLEQQAALDRERGRIARDIHDHLGGTLTQMTLQLELALRSRGKPEKADGHVQRSLDTAREVVKSLDQTVWAVNPVNDTLRHLIDYIGEYAVEFLDCAGIRCRLDFPDYAPNPTVSAEARYHLFLATKEALTNVVRHAGATEVRLGAVLNNGTLSLTVEDNGHGLSGMPAGAGADGLRNMRQRLEEIGGEFEIANGAAGGTRVSFAWPWRNGH
jgi:signal transduction histidine kinase/ligand-binding sensor domain-containing protein